jgi:hypothetical protein
MEILLAMREEMKADHEEMMPWLTNRKDIRKEKIACQEKTEAHLEKDKPASVDTAPEVADNQEVPVEDAEVRSVAEPRKRGRDRRNLAAVRRQKKRDRVLDARCRGKEQGRAQRKNGRLKNSVAARRGTTCRAVMARRRILFAETTQNRLIIAGRKVTRRAQVARHTLSAEETSREFRGSRKGSVAAHRGTTRHVEAARRKEFAIGRNHTCDKIGRGTRRLRALGKGLWTRRVGGTGSEDSSGGAYTVPRNIEECTLWRGRPPPKRKKVAEQEESGMGSPGHPKS